MKLKGLKKAVGDYRRYNAGGRYDPEYGIMYLNTKTGKIWTDEYNDFGHNSWTHYGEGVVNVWHDMERVGMEVAGDTARYTMDMKGIRLYALEGYGFTL